MTRKEAWIGGLVLTLSAPAVTLAWLGMAIGIEPASVLADIINLFNSIMGV